MSSFVVMIPTQDESGEDMMILAAVCKTREDAQHFGMQIEGEIEILEIPDAEWVHPAFKEIAQPGEGAPASANVEEEG